MLPLASFLTLRRHGRRRVRKEARGSGRRGRGSAPAPRADHRANTPFRPALIRPAPPPARRPALNRPTQQHLLLPKHPPDRRLGAGVAGPSPQQVVQACWGNLQIRHGWPSRVHLGSDVRTSSARSARLGRSEYSKAASAACTSAAPRRLASSSSKVPLLLLHFPIRTARSVRPQRPTSARSSCDWVRPR
jgi:hypothetical protein